ncbi:MAG: protein TolQ [Deltaproteobacteria bacterium]|nr:protein TolQ [Deltaproteobacteria bacterium]MBW2070107.1 protein TolQ [Deltaproteobacteria bacterium]
METILFVSPPPVWAAALGGQGSVLEMVLGADVVVKCVLIILSVLSIACWAVILVKQRVFGRANKESSRFLTVFWESKSLAAVFREAKKMRDSHLAEVFRVGYLELGRLTRFSEAERAVRSQDVEMPMSWIDNMERALRSAAAGEVQRLEKGLSLLATTGNAAPFIGLFGTVWGIMMSFQGIGLKGSATLAVVAPGISEALIATAVGLAAAIPAVIAYNHFANKLRGMETEMMNFANDFINLVKRDLLRRASQKEVQELARASGTQR